MALFPLLDRFVLSASVSQCHGSARGEALVIRSGRFDRLEGIAVLRHLLDDRLDLDFRFWCLHF